MSFRQVTAIQAQRIVARDVKAEMEYGRVRLGEVDKFLENGRRS